MFSPHLKRSPIWSPIIPSLSRAPLNLTERPQPPTHRSPPGAQRPQPPPEEGADITLGPTLSVLLLAPSSAPSTLSSSSSSSSSSVPASLLPRLNRLLHGGDQRVTVFVLGQQQAWEFQFLVHTTFVEPVAVVPLAVPSDLPGLLLALRRAHDEATRYLGAAHAESSPWLLPLMSPNPPLCEHAVLVLHEAFGSLRAVARDAGPETLGALEEEDARAVVEFLEQEWVVESG